MFHVEDPPKIALNHRSIGKSCIRSYAEHPADLRSIAARRACPPHMDLSQQPLFAGPCLSAMLAVSDDACKFFDETCPLLWVPDTVLHRIGKLQWTALMFRASWRSKQQEAFCKLLQWPDKEWLRSSVSLGAQQLLEPRPALAFDTGHALALASNLRNWAPKLLAGLEEDEAGETKFLLEDAALRLMAMGDKAMHVRAAQHSTSDAERGLRLMRTFSAARQLRDRGKLSFVFKQSMQVYSIPEFGRCRSLPDYRRHKTDESLIN